MTDKELVDLIAERVRDEENPLDDELRLAMINYCWKPGQLQAEELIWDLNEHHAHSLSHEELGDLLAVVVRAIWWQYVDAPVHDISVRAR